ncbi:uncharacterized protein [Littorina saxatilis]|uniref:Laminin G domain-containing protein n=1 Tax=Littorina saxatilis TaxID=31220 RepID=A0AAN9GIL1_9CAEN
MYCLAVLLVVLTLTHAKKSPCFVFPGETFLEFRPANFNNSHMVHYQLEFQTIAEEGILMYSEGPDDYEALFLSQGKLIYLLTNPSPSGVEGTSGGLYVSEAQVNNDTWFKVDLWRNWEKRGRGGHRGTVLQTGMEIRDPSKNSLETHIDHINHRGVLLDPVVYVGGIKSSLTHTQGTAPPQFEGRIRRIHEQRNDDAFEHYSLNFDNKVKRC